MELRLSCTLRFLAGGSYLDISFLHGISVKTLHPLVKKTVALISDVLQNINFAEVLRSPEERAAVSRGFQDRVESCSKKPTALLADIGKRGAGSRLGQPSGVRGGALRSENFGFCEQENRKTTVLEATKATSRCAQPPSCNPYALCRGLPWHARMSGTAALPHHTTAPFPN